MSTHVLTVTEAVRNFSEYISRVAYRRETFVLRKGTRSVAELRPLPSGRRLGDLPGILSDLPHLTETEAQSFAEDLDAERRLLNEEPVRDPWAS